MCRILERRGWRRVRVRGSHHIYLSPDRETEVLVVVHQGRDMAKKTCREVMKAVGLTSEDL